jgi:hypothetical protein
VNTARGRVGAACRRWTPTRSVLYDLGWLEGAPARAQPVQLASLEVVTQSSSFIGLAQYVCFMPGLATCTLPSPFAWRMFISAHTCSLYWPSILLI